MGESKKEPIILDSPHVVHVEVEPIVFAAGGEAMLIGAEAVQASGLFPSKESAAAALTLGPEPHIKRGEN